MEDSLIYRVSSRTAKTIQRNQVLKNKTREDVEKEEHSFIAGGIASW